MLLLLFAAAGAATVYCLLLLVLVQLFAAFCDDICLFVLGEATSLSWADFVSKCGQRSQLGNPLQAGVNFRDEFAFKTVSWEGLVKQVREGLFAASPSFLLLAMNPTLTAAATRKPATPLTETPGDPGPTRDLLAEVELLEKEEEGMKGDGADLALAFDSHLAEEIAKLNPGDKIAFEATLHELGKR